MNYRLEKSTDLLLEDSASDLKDGFRNYLDEKLYHRERERTFSSLQDFINELEELDLQNSFLSGEVTSGSISTYDRTKELEEKIRNSRVNLVYPSLHFHGNRVFKEHIPDKSADLPLIGKLRREGS